MALQIVTSHDQFTILGSAARTATPTVDTFRVGRPGGLLVFIDVTAASATPSVVFTIQGVDELTGATYDVLASVAVTGIGETRLHVHPAITAAANVKADELVPTTIGLTAVHADADSITYSVTGMLTG